MSSSRRDGAVFPMASMNDPDDTPRKADPGWVGVPMALALSLSVGSLLLSATGCNQDAPVDPNLEDLAGADLTGLDLSAYGDLGGPTTLSSTSDVTILVEPDDKSGALVAAINGATTSVHMTMYLLTAQPVIDALVARKQAGKEVKVLLNKTFPSAMGTNANTPLP